MKRKFSFNLAPIKTGTKHETKHTPEPTPSHQKQPSQPPSQSSQSHSRQTSKDSICDHSPFIQRRVLDPKTDHELRAACRLILQNFKPSDHGMEDTDPKLDFGGLQRGRERTKDRNAHRSEPKVRLPTGAPVDLKTALEARGLKQTELTLGKQPGDAPTRANSSRKRADFGWLDDRDEKREANLRKSSSTRRKRSIDPASDAAANATATEWMRNGESSREHPSDPQARPSTAVRPPSRSKSIRNNIKEYVFPGTNSRSLSRAPSHGSLNTMNTNLSQDSSADPPTSATSASGWRNWALPRRSSSRSNSRPGTSRGQPEEADQSKKPNPNVVNLTKELPPLPSLDSWKDNDEPPQEKVKSPTSATHIASVMRPQDAPQPERTTAQRKQHRRSGSDTLVMQYNASVAARSPTHSKHGAPTGSRSKTLTPDSLGVATTLVGSSSTSNLDYTRHRSSESTSTPKKSSEIVNFSRKMSVEVSTRSNFSHEAKLSRKEEQKSRLKKVFTGWMSKKEKKDHWMHRIEKEGVKEGVLVQDSASAPIVRY